MKRVPLAADRRWVYVAVPAVLVAAAGAGAVVWFSRQTEPSRSPVLVLDSSPSGAIVTIGNDVIGETPVRVVGRAPGAELAATFSLAGYLPVTTTVSVPTAVPLAVHLEPLAPSPDFVRVRIVSTPPGAQIIRSDEPPAPGASREYAPAELLLEAGKPHRIVLRMPSYEPLALDPITPTRSSPPVELTARLTPAR